VKSWLETKMSDYRKEKHWDFHLVSKKEKPKERTFPGAKMLDD